MTTEPVDHLADATRRRADSTRARAREAIRQMDRHGQAINYVTVAQSAGVSRSLLYRDASLRAEIDKLRGPAPTGSPRRTPTSERMSQASRDEILNTLRAEVHALREENRALRDRLASVLGQERATHEPRQPHVAEANPQATAHPTGPSSR